MQLSKNLATEALKAMRDESEDRRVCATALMLTLGPADEFPELAQTAARNSLSGLFNDLAASAADLMTHDGAGRWVVRAPDAEACIARLRNRIKTSTVVWLIHGGRSEAWKEVGRHLERSMGLKYVEFDDAQAKRVLITERVATMASTSTLAIAIMSAEDRQPDGKVRSRQNVVHEIGLAQGFIGIDRVIIMRESGIEDFTNLGGLVYISFTPSDLNSAFLKLQDAIDARMA